MRAHIRRQTSLAARLAFGICALASVAPALAQRSIPLQIQLSATNQLELSWLPKSIVPRPGPQIFPNFQLQTSGDLTNWSAVGEVVSGTNKLLRQTLATGTAARAFYRLETFVSLPGADFRRGTLTNTDFSGADLSGADFQLANLNDSVLTGARLAGADLRFAQATGVDFGRADLFGATLDEADLSESNFARANAAYADFSSAVLFNTDFSDADLRATVFFASDLRFVALHRTKIDDRTMLDDKTRLIWRLVNEGVAGLVLTNADLRSATLDGVDFHDVDLRGADLFASDFRNVDLRGANLRNATVDFLDLRGTKLDEHTVIDDKWRRIARVVTEGASNPELHDLTGADFQRGYFFKADLRGAILVKANFSSAFLRNADLSGSDLGQANLSNATLVRVNLSHANLLGARITGADLTEAIFDQTVMPDGKIRSR